jgi:hypothetical protein
MTTRKILILAALAGLLLMMAIWYGGLRQAERGDAVRAELLPDLTEQVNQVSGLRLSGAGGELLWEISRQDEQWTMDSRGGYPVDFTRVRELLLKLARAQKLEPKTSNPSLYERLGVQDIGEAEAEGLLLEVQGTNPPIALIVGRANATSDGNFVRPSGEAQSWLVDVALPIQREPVQWLQRELAKVPVSRVLRVEILHAGGNRVELVRNDEPGSDFKVGNLPRGREQGFSYMADAAGALLSDLRFDDVMPSSELPLPDDEGEISRARFELEDGLVYRIDSWRDEEKTFVQIAVELDEARAAESIAAVQAQLQEAFEARQTAADAAAPADAAVAAGETPGEATDATEIAPAPPAAVSDPQGDAANRLAQLRKEMSEANTRFAGWSYTLPSQQATNFNRKHEAYLKAED